AVAVERGVDRVAGLEVADAHGVSGAPRVADEGTAHHVVVLAPVAVGIRGGMDADETLSAFHELHEVPLVDLLLLRSGAPEDIPGGIEHEDRVELRKALLF